MTRIVLARALAILTFALLAATACSSESDSCASGTTKVCLADGTTCACAPDCQSAKDCSPYTACLGSTCTSCASGKCACSTNLCVPDAWQPGQQLTFKH